MNEQNSFEEKLKEVEDIISALEEGKSGLDESMKKYEAGMMILRNLEQELNNAEQKLSVIRDGKEIPMVSIENE